MELSNKNAIVTGATSGLGKEIATALARKNTNLVLIGHDQARLDALASELRGFGKGKLTYQRVDLRDSASLARAMPELAATFPKVDAVYCCAGLRYVGICTEIDAAKLAEMFAVNYFSVVSLLKNTIPRMSRGGHIFLISSGSANFGVQSDAGYSSSKAALERYAEATRAELRTLGIHVTSVSPGTMETRLFRESPGYDGRIIANPAKPASSAALRASQIIAQTGKDKRKLNLTFNPFIIRALSLFAPGVLDFLTKPKK